MSWTAGNEVETQRRGIVVLIWFDKSFQLTPKPVQNKPKLHEVTMIRLCAVHLCTPDTPLYRVKRSFITMRTAHNRLKLRVHVGMFRCHLYVFVDLFVTSFLPLLDHLYKNRKFLMTWFLSNFLARKHVRKQLQVTGLRYPYRDNPHHVFRDRKIPADAPVDAATNISRGTHLPRHYRDPIDH